VPTSELSTGTRRICDIAAQVAASPQLLLLDEPTAGVDPNARREFWEELHRLAAKGISVLVSTHYMDEAERCHKLAYILEGRLLAQGTAAEIIADQHLETYELKGGDLGALSARLQSMPGVEEVAAFGDALHVTGAAGRGLADTLAGAVQGSDTRLSRIDTSIEDVFIHMMRSAGEGRRDDATPA